MAIPSSQRAAAPTLEGLQSAGGGAGVFAAVCAVAYLGLAVIGFLFPRPSVQSWVALLPIRLPTGSLPLPLPLPLAYLLYALCMVAAWAGYLGLLRLRRRVAPRWLALIFAAVAVAILLAPPYLSADVYAHLSYGRIAVAYHGNPYFVMGGQYPQDPVIALNVDWPNVVPYYGPAWLLLMNGVMAVVGTNAWLGVVLVRLISLAGVAGCAVLVAKLGERVQGQDRGWLLALVLINPLFLVESAFNAHNDALMLALFLLAVWLGLQGRWWGWVFAAASVLVKFVTVLPAALLGIQQMRAQPRRVWLVGVAAFVAVIVLLFAPFWGGPSTLGRLSAVGSDYTTLSLPALAQRVFERIPWLAAGGPARVNLATRGLMLLPLLGLQVLFMVRQRSSPVQLLRQSALLLLAALLLGSGQLRQWYFIWPAAFAFALAPGSLATMAQWFCVAACFFYASPIFAGSFALRALFAGACFAWPAYLAAREYWHELRWGSLRAASNGEHIN